MKAPRRWLLAATLLAACASPRPPRSPSPAPAARAQTSAQRLEAQRRAYDRGLAEFGEERYAEARRAWAQAAGLAPKTALGRKAQANLEKVDAMLRRLEELDRP